MKESSTAVFATSTLSVNSRNRSAGMCATPMTAVLAISFALLAGCSGPELVPAETALADQMTDCAYLSTRHMLLADELGVPVEKGYASVGYYRAAGIVLSSEAHAGRRFDQARTRYLQSEQSTGVTAADLTAKRTAMTLLEKQLADCSQLSRSHRDFISPKVAAFIAHSK